MFGLLSCSSNLIQCRSCDSLLQYFFPLPNFTYLSNQFILHLLLPHLILRCRCRIFPVQELHPTLNSIWKIPLLNSLTSKCNCYFVFPLIPILVHLKCLKKSFKLFAQVLYHLQIRLHSV